MKKILKLLLISLFSISFVACRKGNVENKNLNPPSNLKINGDILSWDSVKEATHYVVVVNEIEKETTKFEIDLTTFSLTNGVYKIGVHSVNNDGRSKISKLINYKVEFKSNKDDVLLYLLKEINNNYELNMKLTDFPNNDLFDQYQFYNNLFNEFINVSNEYRVSDEKIKNISNLILNIDDYANNDLNEFEIKRFIKDYKTLNLNSDVLTKYIEVLFEAIVDQNIINNEYLNIYINNKEEIYKALFEVISFMTDYINLFNENVIDDIKELSKIVSNELLESILLNVFDPLIETIPEVESFNLVFEVLIVLIKDINEIKTNEKKDVSSLLDNVELISKGLRNTILFNLNFTKTLIPKIIEVGILEEFETSEDELSYMIDLSFIVLETFKETFEKSNYSKILKDEVLNLLNPLFKDIINEIFINLNYNENEINDIYNLANDSIVSLVELLFSNNEYYFDIYYELIENKEIIKNAILNQDFFTIFNLIIDNMDNSIDYTINELVNILKVIKIPLFLSLGFDDYSLMYDINELVFETKKEDFLTLFENLLMINKNFLTYFKDFYNKFDSFDEYNNYMEMLDSKVYDIHEDVLMLVMIAKSIQSSSNYNNLFEQVKIDYNDLKVLINDVYKRKYNNNNEKLDDISELFELFTNILFIDFDMDLKQYEKELLIRYFAVLNKIYLNEEYYFSGKYIKYEENNEIVNEVFYNEDYQLLTNDTNLYSDLPININDYYNVKVIEFKVPKYDYKTNGTFASFSFELYNQNKPYQYVYQIDHKDNLINSNEGYLNSFSFDASNINKNNLTFILVVAHLNMSNTNLAYGVFYID